MHIIILKQSFCKSVYYWVKTKKKVNNNKNQKLFRCEFTRTDKHQLKKKCFPILVTIRQILMCLSYISHYVNFF